MSVSLSRGPTRLPALLRWGAPPVSVLLAHVGNELIPQGHFPAPFFITAVMIVAHFAGVWPALSTFVLSGLLLDYHYLPPFHSFGIRREVLPSLSQFVVPSALGAWFIEKRKRAEWLLEREAEFARRLQGDQSLTEIGDAVLRYLAAELGAPLAAFYSVDVDRRAQRRSTYAFELTRAPTSFAVGEGLVGQAVLEGLVKSTKVPPAYVTVRSSLGEQRPSHVVVVPASDGEQVQAVVELALFAALDRSSSELLDRLREPLAIAVRSAVYRTRLQNLLEETQRQAEELQSHDEELRAANEELQERGEVMLRTQRLLEQQQAELEQTNHTLREQATRLGEQNEEVARAHDLANLRSMDAERANLAKSEFLANMSHELRTPLNSSLILSKLLMEDGAGNLTPDQVRFAETIHSAGNDLLAMIDEILDLAKIESGKLELRLERVDVARLREALMRTFEPVAAERRVHFEIRVDDRVPHAIACDSQRLSQILKNLLSNAFKFTEKGQVSLEIALHDGRLRCAVSDTGIGIEAQHWGSIFEAFRQADGTTNRKYGGTGLGLTISRDLARLLGGDLTVNSVPGAGSTFTLDLPLQVELPAGKPQVPGSTSTRRLTATLAPRRPSKSAALADAAPAPAGRRRILIVEDDPQFARIVGELAHELGFESTLVGTSEAALEESVQRLPDGIVLDMNLPDGPGLSLLDRLKRDARTRHIPVHVISASDYTRVALEMGALGYLLKPIERARIKAALEKLQTKFTGTPRRLLVVEDDEGQREAIVQLLGGGNVEIVAVGSVREALAELRTGALDCVVTDLVLPDGTGYDLLRTMAEDEAYSFPSVVVYTGRSLTLDEEQRLRQYSSSIIVKGARSPERLLDEVTLFLHQVEAQLPPERQRMLEKARRLEPVFEGRRVLVVEDDVRNIFALSSVLEPKGMKVTIARNGREGLEALEIDPEIDLVLMDVMMPEMDGMAAMQAIRRQPRWAKLPIIALTAKAMKDDRARCLQAGASEYMAKPLDVDLLLSLLRIWMPK